MKKKCPEFSISLLVQRNYEEIVNITLMLNEFIFLVHLYILTTENYFVFMALN